MKTPLPLATLALASLAIVAQAIPGAATALEYSRDATAAGEWWRFITAHWVHFDANHLRWDVVVFTALGAVCETQDRTRFGIAIALAAPAITFGLWLWQPQFSTYRGLSGVDCALFGLFAGLLLHHQGSLARLAGWTGLLGAAGKTGFELTNGTTLFADGIGYAPVPLAHLIGFAAGLVAACLPTGARLTSLRQTTGSSSPQPCP